MPKTVSGQDMQNTTAFIDKVVEPKMRRLVEEVNKFLNAKGIVIGCEIQWFINHTEEKSSNEKAQS